MARGTIATPRRRRDGNLRSGGILALPIGEVTSLGAFIQALGASGLGLGLAGPCDAAEEDCVKRGLERAGMGTRLNRSDLEATGFFAGGADLEYQWIRAMGTTGVETVLDARRRRFMGARARPGSP